MKGVRPLLSVVVSAFGVSTFLVTGVAGGSPPPVKVRVTLSQQHVVAGHTIKGTVVLTNTTAESITVNTCAANGWLTVGLSGRVNSYPFAHTLIGCAPTVRLAPGANRFSVTVITTYAGCTQPQPSGGSSSTASLPTCTVAGPPPLPTGTYFTKVDLVGLDGVAQILNRVVVHLKAPKHPPPLAPCADQPGTAPPAVTVPNVVGENSLAAASVLAKACLNAGYANPVGSSVIAEAPTAGSKVPEYSTVTLTTR